MRTLMRGRIPFVVLFLLCGGLLAYAYYAQFVLELAPCPLCMLQRFGFMIMGVAALGAAIHNPRGLVTWVYALPFFGGAIWGAVTAGRHVRLQGLPPDPMGGCGADWPTMLEFGYSFSEILREAFTASGDCSKVSWTFLGLSMPAWTLIWYVLLAVVMVAVLIARKPVSR